MKNRQLIQDINEDLQLNTINEIKELFGEKFLTKGRDLNTHQLKILWNRVDYLATVELYLIGHSIKHNKDNKEWIEDLKIKVVKNKVGSIRGFLYESFISSVIGNSELADPSQECFDLKIKNHNSFDINLSIKKMHLSEKEIEYRRNFEYLENRYKQILQTNKLNGVMLIIKTDEYDYDKIYNIIKDVPKLIKKSSFYDGIRNGMEVAIFKMKTDYALFQDKLSYQFNLIIPFDKIEETRFIKKLKKSLININKLNLEENELNSILIGLSPSQSIYEAKKILEKEINKDCIIKGDDSLFITEEEANKIDPKDKYRNILFVVLSKHLLVTSKDNSIHIRHEFAYVINIKNFIKLKDKVKNSFKPFIFNIQVGSIGFIDKKNEESYPVIGRLNVKDCYNYQAISKHEFIENYEDGKQYNISNIAQCKENSITFKKDEDYITVSPFNYGKYENFLIL